MAEYDGNTSEANKQHEKFINATENPNYGGMYNTYLINLYAETNPEKALEVGCQEKLTNRATPETYQLLAYSQLNLATRKVPLKRLKNMWKAKHEPKALFHSALIYKANGMEEKVADLKEELMSAFYEFGPLKSKEIEKL